MCYKKRSKVHRYVANRILSLKKYLQNEFNVANISNYNIQFEIGLTDDG